MILTHHALPSLFFETLKVIAPAYFEQGYAALESACNSISKWYARLKTRG